MIPRDDQALEVLGELEAALQEYKAKFDVRNCYAFGWREEMQRRTEALLLRARQAREGTPDAPPES